MHRADDEEPRRRNGYGEEGAAVVEHAGAPRAQPPLQLGRKRILLDGVPLDEALRPVCGVGDEDRGAALTARGVELLKNVELHRTVTRGHSCL